MEIERKESLYHPLLLQKKFILEKENRLLVGISEVPDLKKIKEMPSHQSDTTAPKAQSDI